MATSKQGNNNYWTWEQDKAFEKGLAIYPENCEQRWEKIARQIPGHKTIEQVKYHYQILLDDIASIEQGNVDELWAPSSNKSRNGKKSDWEKRRGQPWTEEEHKQFLMGMDRYGKGDWKTIAREFVKTRTSTQVASHAQKYFQRKEKKKKKEAKRWSIFDITSPRDEVERENNNRITSIGELPTMVARPVSPPLSSPSIWCRDSDDDVLELAYQECLSQLPPL